MKKISIVILMSILSFNVLFSLDLSLDGLETQFESLSDSLGSAVTSNATTGLTWSDSNLESFPHFGAGIFTGAAIIPLDGFDDLIELLTPGVSLPDAVSSIGGLLLPVFGIDARIGGFVIPFDVGIKYGVVNAFELDVVTFDYQLIGADFRYALLKENLVLPGISVGVGVNRLTTDISISGLIDDQEIKDGSTTLLTMKSPDLNFGWEATVIELKAQVSKKILFITPYLGVNAAYGMTTIGGGLSTEVLDQNGDTITQSEIDSLLETAGLPSMTITGFDTTTDSTSWGAKVTGGLSFDILFVAKLDISVNYDLIAKVYGGQLGFRLQL
ncbi:MAG: hypothetical protein OCD02_20690 [Spirochaetaceae bacterium]